MLFDLVAILSGIALVCMLLGFLWSRYERKPTPLTEEEVACLQSELMEQEDGCGPWCDCNTREI